LRSRKKIEKKVENIHASIPSMDYVQIKYMQIAIELLLDIRDLLIDLSLDMKKKAIRNERKKET